MLANVSGDNLTVLRVGMSEDVLNEVVAILITCNIDKGNTGSIHASLTDAIQVSAQEFGPANFQAFLNNLGSELIHRVLRGISNDMIDGTAPVSRSAVLTDVLDAPITELTMGHNVNVEQDLLDAGTLHFHIS